MRVILRILGFLRPYRGAVAVAYVSTFLALGFQLAIPAVLAAAIDNGVVEEDAGYLARAALLILALAAGQGLFTFGRAYLFNRVAEQAGTDLRDQLYVHLQALPFSYYDRAQTGQLMSRATEDINAIRQMLMMSLRTIVLIAGTLIAVAVILVRIDWLLAAVALAVYPPLVFFSYRFGVGIRPMFARVQQQFGVMTSALQENVAGGRVVRAFAQEASEVARFEAELTELLDRNVATARRWSFSYALMLLLSGVGIAAVVWLGGHRVLAGAMSIGALVAFNRYLTLLAEPIRWLGFVVNRVAHAVASGERIFTVLDTRPTIADRAGAVALDPATVRGAVAFEGVTFRYPGAKRDALVDVSFTASPGQTVALVGPTGAGKSTVTALIPRFYDVATGRVTVDGRDVRELRLDSLRAEVGSVPQETFLFSVSLRENIALGRPGATDDEVVAAAKAARAHDFIAALPEGYETEVGERGVSLSGGQKQRIAIARALLRDPRILVLDDATSAVDSETESEIQEALRTLMAGRTSLVIAQRLDTVRDADQILVLQDGRITERGTHAELLANGGFYRELYDLQRRDRALAQTGLEAVAEVAADAPVASPNELVAAGNDD